MHVVLLKVTPIQIHEVVMRLYEFDKSLIIMYHISHVETITVRNYEIFPFP